MTAIGALGSHGACDYLAVPANATERAVRGQSRKAMKDGIYRASLRGDSTHVRAQAEAVASELLRGKVRVEPGKLMLADTRKRMEGGWRAVAATLTGQGCSDAASIERFVSEMPPPWTEHEWVAHALRARLPSRERERYQLLRHR